MDQNPALRTLHTIWLREHNRVAQHLVRLIPNRTDEFYFQEAGRIVIAEYQHITFTEFQPVFLNYFSLRLHTTSFFILLTRKNFISIYY